MTKSLSKVNLASLKVLYTLQLLFERDLSMPDLIKYYELYHNEYNSNFIMSKYINTCRYCGIDIKKINNKYTIVNFPIGVKFSPGELSLFNELKNCCEKIKLGSITDSMQSLLNKINKYLDRPISVVSTSAVKDAKIKNFEKACILSQKIKIIFNDDRTLQCEPIDITFGEDKVLLTVFDGLDSSDISPSDVKQIKILPQKSTSKYMPRTVMFEIRGRLAKNYQIRPHEQIWKIYSNGDIVISNRFEDKFKLIHRLMRYGENCKLLSPQSYVDDMKKLIDETLSNYNEV